MSRTNYEERFYLALKTITSYMTVAQLRRNCGEQYGLDHAEALEMAYENVIGEAKFALRGYKKPRTAPPVDAASKPDPAKAGSVK